MEVLALISQSMTNEEIAEKLFLSPKTVKTHLRNIFAKSRDAESGRGCAYLHTSCPNIELVVFDDLFLTEHIGVQVVFTIFFLKQNFQL
ncbi:MAG: helix-turn-helix transcriptional regulator [Desulfobacterales bacterium]|nr:helix-turn-helix transcriptional regulator [Desulfobacterales bacterium]